MLITNLPATAPLTSASPVAQPGGAAEQARLATLLQVPRPSLPPRPAGR
ncbi:hypothetical protein [Pseudoroseomonas cervicalis]|nr:hypothetical protein [Pseudoroseomonas cervicalis]MDQ1080384.1 hypothetical protein [Pseudoroseomonas cervicalis]